MATAPIYGSSLEEAELRIKNLKSKFAELFDGDQPDLFARSPGRVNLIGEHIDYEGYSVLPMAIRQDTIVGIKKRSDSKPLLRIGNVNDKYSLCTYPADANQVQRLVFFGNILSMSYKGFYEFAKAKGFDLGAPVGLDVVVDGIVPTGSGLSSSAAFVCSATIAIMAAFDAKYPKKEIAQLTCECERHIGTQSGGMDQVKYCMAYYSLRGRGNGQKRPLQVPPSQTLSKKEHLTPLEPELVPEGSSRIREEPLVVLLQEPRVGSSGDFYSCDYINLFEVQLVDMCFLYASKEPILLSQDDEEQVGYELDDIDAYLREPSDISFDGDIGHTSYIPGLFFLVGLV
ncbi:uncharacterized protein A4U43_C06F15090 [Asparagus officinalis]|uniref:Galactokinase N-terminal domain-containing protein n=1 Tax=Asparagus officinalis TaxID=4686 RepID=A0A5P1EM98_ASPOF|nr:uncharacterized protein A4U43_C06F15090 [Asparagus officinalis]